MPMKIKVPVKDLETDDIFMKVEKKLKSDSENAYTIGGLMVEVFNIKKEQIHNKPFRDWDKGLPTMYGRINRSLSKLKDQGLVKSRKHGRAWVYWWNYEKVMGI